MAKSFHKNRSFTTTYELTFQEPRFAEAFTHRFGSFVGIGKGDIGRQQALVLGRSDAVCTVTISDLTYAGELAEFFQREIKDGTSVRSINPDLPERIYNQVFAEQGRLITELEAATTRGNESEQELATIRKNYQDLEERRLTAEETAARKEKEYRALQEEIETRGRAQREQIASLEKALEASDSFVEETARVARINERFETIRALLGDQDLEQVYANAQESEQIYILKTSAHAERIQREGIETILKIGAENIENLPGYTERETAKIEAQETMEYFNRLKGYIQEGKVTPEASRVLGMPIGIILNVYKQTEAQVPEMQERIREADAFVQAHEETKRVAEEIQRLQREYKERAALPEKIAEILGKEKTIGLRVKLLGKQETKYIFETELPIPSDAEETALYRQVQLCALAPVLEETKFPGIELQEQQKGERKVYRFSVAEQAAKDPKEVFNLLYDIAEKMTALE